MSEYPEPSIDMNLQPPRKKTFAYLILAIVGLILAALIAFIGLIVMALSAGFGGSDPYGLIPNIAIFLLLFGGATVLVELITLFGTPNATLANIIFLGFGFSIMAFGLTTVVFGNPAAGVFIIVVSGLYFLQSKIVPKFIELS